MHRKELELIQLNKKIVLFSRHALNSKGRSFSKEIQKAEQGRWTRHVSSRWVVARPKPFAVRLHYGKNADMEAVKEKYQDRPSQGIHWPGERWCSHHENTCEQVEHHETCREFAETSWQNFHVLVWHKILQVYRIHLLPSICIRLLDVLQRYQDLFRRRLNSTGDPVPFNVFKTYMMEARWIAWILCQCLERRNL